MQARRCRDMTDYIQVWQCVGCGRIEAPQPCLGVCRDRKTWMVGKGEHEQALARMRQLEQRIDALRMLLVRFVAATPRSGGWEASWRLLQEQARHALEADASGAAAP